MTPHQILAALTRLLAVWWVLYLISHTPGLVVHNEQLHADNRIAVVVVTGLQLAICAYLWLFPATVARKLLPLKDGSSHGSLSSSDWPMLGVVFIGLWALTQAIPDAVYWAILMNSWIGPRSMASALTVAQQARIASVVVNLAVGIGFVFGARPITDYVFGAPKGP